MARLFDGAVPQWFEAAAVPKAAVPLTMCAWVRSNSEANVQTILTLANTGVANNYFTLRFVLAPLRLRLQVRSSAPAANALANTTTNWVGDTWYHVAGVAAAVNDYTTYLDGGGAGVSAVNVVPVAVDRSAIGVRNDGGVAANGFRGDIAHCCVYDVALSAQEVLTLAQGVSPLQMRPDDLLAYWPVGGQTNEPDVVGGLAMVPQGAAATQSEGAAPSGPLRQHIAPG